MTSTRALRIGRPRRFTANLLVPVDLLGHRLIVKYTRNPAEAREEIRGHARLAPHYRVPALHTNVRVPGGRILLYERLEGGRDQGLLLDLLNAHDVSSSGLDTYMEQLTDAYRMAIQHTARLTEPAHLVRKLYWDRAAPGGRLDAYYSGADFPIADSIIGLPVSHLGAHTLVINGRHLTLDWQSTLDWLKNHFGTDDPVWAAVTQGDPTDVNLAHPPAWYDYDTAGLNSILGEFANFLWYTTALGGWLVPTYNPAALADHPATFAHLPANTPQVHHAALDPATQAIHIRYTAAPSTARRSAATTYWQQLVQPVAARLWPGADLAELLRPYLAMRILAVYNLADLSPLDRLVILARLAEAVAPSFDPIAYFHLLEAPCPAR